MQLTLKIENEAVAQKILWLLEHFKKDGLEIKTHTVPDIEEKNYSDEYIKEHWKEIIMSVGSDDTYYKSEQYDIERGEYLAEKYS